MTDDGSAASTEDALRRRIAKLERINAALMGHVERVTDKHEGAYSLFQTAIMLDGRVRRRTEELTGLMHQLERSNSALELAKDEAEQANRSKTRFLAAASHDLLQPLQAARLSVSTLGDLLLGDLPLGAAAAGMMHRVDRGLAEIEELIRTLLDISKLDAGVVKPNLGAVALDDLLGEIEVGYRAQAEARGLRLAIRCTAGLTAHSNGKLLGRIVGNLVSNAIRYTEGGGVLVAARRRGGCCRLDVVDTGRGIADSERDLVFEEFFRGRAAEGNEKGLGLGLAIVRRMAATLDHPLSFRSRVGHGTWFTMGLPLRDEAETPRRMVRNVAASPSGNISILLVAPGGADGELQALLRGWDMDVTVACDAAAAADACGVWSPAMILIDRRAGGGVDPQELDALRRSSSQELPVAVLLARDAEDCTADVAIMREPIKPARLRSLLASLLGQLASR